MGCGWLGAPLAKHLADLGHNVHGSTTSDSKVKTLRKSGISPYMVLLEEQGVYGNIDAFLNNMEFLILNIPSKLKKPPRENYIFKLQHLIEKIAVSSIEKLLFISSTSIYANSNSAITEASTPEPQTESGKQLLTAEKLLESLPNISLTILRFGGLIGPDRHPVLHLAGKSGLKNPDAPVNLIHRDDCIAIITKIIETQCWGTTFNAVYPSYPTRQQYYQEVALRKLLPLPEFVSNTVSQGKMVRSDKLIRELPYQFKTPI